MYILGVGMGNFDPKSTPLTTSSNPQRRDVQIVPANGYLVWQADANNPGSWIFHCHIAWHLSAGLAIQVLENLNAVSKLNVPQSSQQLCQSWNSYTTAVGGQSSGGGDEYQQVDSGL